MYTVDLVIFNLELDYEKIGDLTIEDIKRELSLLSNSKVEIKVLNVEEEDIETGELKNYRIKS